MCIRDRIYNDENKDISIPKIYIDGGANSQYRLNVDGKPGIDFTNVSLRKKDSLYIFVEIAPNSNATEAIAEDRIQIESPVGNQHVTLLSVVQNVDSVSYTHLDVYKRQIGNQFHSAFIAVDDSDCVWRKCGDFGLDSRTNGLNRHVRKILCH